eukprot:scaffold49792_cov63-Cyclotella_meneghiniana.AAC.1
MNSNLNLAKPFIMLMMKEGRGWDAVKCPNQSKLTQSWCQKWTRVIPTLTPPVTGKQVAVTIIEIIYQYQASPTIHYTFDETLEGLRCCETLLIHDNKNMVETVYSSHTMCEAPPVDTLK